MHSFDLMLLYPDPVWDCGHCGGKITVSDDAVELSLDNLWCQSCADNYLYPCKLCGKDVVEIDSLCEDCEEEHYGPC